MHDYVHNEWMSDWSTVRSWSGRATFYFQFALSMITYLLSGYIYLTCLAEFLAKPWQTKMSIVPSHRHLNTSVVEIDLRSPPLNPMLDWG